MGQEDQGVCGPELLSSEPWHHFVQKKPKTIGIVILICGCAELIVGFYQASEEMKMSSLLYIPFWQGILFLVCGLLSIYTGIHPSKEMVTGCLVMYVVSFIGVLVSVCFRIYLIFVFIVLLSFFAMGGSSISNETGNRVFAIEALLLISSLCVSVLLIILSGASCSSLKSTHTQIVLHQIVPPVTETPTE